MNIKWKGEKIFNIFYNSFKLFPYRGQNGYQGNQKNLVVQFGTTMPRYFFFSYVVGTISRNFLVTRMYIISLHNFFKKKKKLNLFEKFN